MKRKHICLMKASTKRDQLFKIASNFTVKELSKSISRN